LGKWRNKRVSCKRILIRANYIKIIELMVHSEKWLLASKMKNSSTRGMN
jgi:hypothetical protein